MNTFAIIENYFQTLFPEPELRRSNLRKLGHFLDSQYTILILNGPKSTGRHTLFQFLTLSDSPIRTNIHIFPNDEVFEVGTRLLCITSSLQPIGKFPQYKPLIVSCKRHFTPSSKDLEVTQCLSAISFFLLKASKDFEVYDPIPEYQPPAINWLQKRALQLYLKNPNRFKQRAAMIA